MPDSNSNPAAAVLVLLLSAGLTACGKTDSPQNPPRPGAAGGAGPDRCALLTDEEVTAAIGVHHGGSIGSLERPSLWGAESCRWTAVAAREIAGYGTWTDAIEVAVFDKTRESWHRSQAEGEPVEGLGAGALYNENNGELWFDCGDGRFCAIKAHTAAGEGRPELAQRLAKIVRGRMKSQS
jgi:hypothetical protein